MPLTTVDIVFLSLVKSKVARYGYYDAKYFVYAAGDFV
jgi:hypothetical protein